MSTPSRYTNEKLASILEYIKSITSETFCFPKNNRTMKEYKRLNESQRTKVKYERRADEIINYTQATL